MSRRLPRPSRLRGPVQRGVWRAFIMSGGRDLTTSELMEFTHTLAMHRPHKAVSGPADACRTGVDPSFGLSLYFLDKHPASTRYPKSEGVVED